MKYFVPFESGNCVSRYCFGVSPDNAAVCGPGTFEWLADSLLRPVTHPHLKVECQHGVLSAVFECICVHFDGQKSP